MKKLTRLILPSQVLALKPGEAYLCVGSYRCQIKIPQREFVGKVRAFIPRGITTAWFVRDGGTVNAPHELSAASEGTPVLSMKLPPGHPDRPIHGEYRHIHAGIKDRCTNPRSQGWNAYGGKGVDFDPRWNDYGTFEHEIEDLIGKRPAPIKRGRKLLKYTVNRRDNAKGYWPENIKNWALPEQQAQERGDREPELPFDNSPGLSEKSL